MYHENYLVGTHAFTSIFFASEQAKKDFHSIVAAMHVHLKTIRFFRLAHYITF